MFTAAELAELAAFDAQVDEDFEITPEEFVQADKRDHRAALENMDAEKRKKREYARRWAQNHKPEQKEYYRKNKERVKARSKAYYAAHREEILARKRMLSKIKKPLPEVAVPSAAKEST